ncbi:type II toxin-antitoxin system PemK/MazF family toxin [Nodosilinea sp. P-1105]|uniref:type II toxin-antitoxin system PemK/MazF family toxin n=1 Tax=Nodosilinea sp. P-1105 TaxID=2546229 RepID=UPI00146E8D06|nr:type II toxin-antitoxin system PemK/MazF family toxin [Nodosilinea sp. P-1105]NMF85200.1 type II toxin-antitoxin system PemK/MazF family toxin [Nodosilinea sp. P-1105]
MVQEGQIVLFPFPNTDQTRGKLRPALVLRQCPSQYDDWLICMISSRLAQCIANLNEIIAESDSDFNASGLRQASVIRVTRLAVVNRSIFLGSTGEVSGNRFSRIKQKLATWILA